VLGHGRSCSRGPIPGATGWRPELRLEEELGKGGVLTDATWGGAGSAAAEMDIVPAALGSSVRKKASQGSQASWVSLDHSERR
jgi:hypothetical protein